MALSIPYLLTLITFLPLLGAVIVTLVPGDGAKKWLALATTLVTFLLSLLLWTNWQDGYAGMQFMEDVVWFAPLGIRYALGEVQIEATPNLEKVAPGWAQNPPFPPPAPPKATPAVKP